MARYYLARKKRRGADSGISGSLVNDLINPRLEPGWRAGLDASLPRKVKQTNGCGAIAQMSPFKAWNEARSVPAFPRRRLLSLTSNSPVVSPPSFQTSNFIPEASDASSVNTPRGRQAGRHRAPLATPRQPPTQKSTSPTFLFQLSPPPRPLFTVFRLSSSSFDRRG